MELIYGFNVCLIGFAVMNIRRYPTGHPREKYVLYGQIIDHTISDSLEQRTVHSYSAGHQGFVFQTANIHRLNEYKWFGDLTKPSFQIISNLTTSNPNIYQAM